MASEECAVNERPVRLPQVNSNGFCHSPSPKNKHMMCCYPKHSSLHLTAYPSEDSLLQRTKLPKSFVSGSNDFTSTHMLVLGRMLDIVDGAKEELLVLFLTVLSQVRPKQSTGDATPWSSIHSAAIHNVLKSPKAEMCIQYVCRMVSRLHLRLIEPLSSFKSITSTVGIKGSAPGGGAKGVVGEPRDLIYVVLGWSGDVPAQSIEVFDPQTQSWSFFQKETPCTRAYHGVAMINNEIYAVGGFNGHRCQSTMLCLNMQSGIWRRRRSMSVPRCYVSAVVLKGLVYAIGGHNGSHRLRSCEVYCPESNRWANVADMACRRSDAGAAELNGRIYVCGGFDGFNFHSTAECYDPGANQWTAITSLINPRSGHSMTAIEGCIFALGGFNGTERMHDVEKYNVEDNTWESYEPMITGRSNFCTTVLQGELYAVGGYDGINTTSKVEKLNLQKGCWEVVPDMRTHRSAAGACISISGAKSSACGLTDYGIVSSTNVEGSSP